MLRENEAMRLLRGKIEALRLENDTQRRKNEALCLENDQLRRENETLRARQPAAVSAASAWEPFEALLQSSPLADVTGGDKLVMPAKYFLFGHTKAFMDGLPGMLTGGLLLSMAEEARNNEQGKWLAEFEYVVNREAVEDVPDLTTTTKFKGKLSSSGNIIVRDHGHGGMTLADFYSHEMARAAELTEAEVAALRLYSGPMFAPLNYALRTENISEWATTISCCYSGVLKLSFLSQPARVYRGVKEDEMQLPDEFLNREEGKFAGGVERAFMSTTKSAAVALDYSGGGAVSGSIFVIDFDMNSRGASIQFLSQYPHEEELLFPPCTGLACLDVSQHGRKRCVLVSAQVSTARLDTREVTTPTRVPGTEAALQWAAEVLFENSSVEEVIGKEEWNLEGRNLSHDEHAERLALLLGRAATVAAPRVRSVSLEGSQLSPAGGAAIGKALRFNAVLTKMKIGSYELDLPKLRGTDPVASLELGNGYIGLASAASTAIVIASLIADNAVLTKLKFDRHELDLPKLRGTDPVASLDLRDMGLASAIVIASLIADNAVLTKLKLDAWHGQHDSWLDLRKLRGTDPVASLDLRDMGLGRTSAIVIASLIADNAVLTNLNLHGNNIGHAPFGFHEGAEAIGKALAVNGVLTTLDLSGNSIQDGGATAIGKALKVNGVLKRLDLSRNHLGPEGAKAIGAALRGNAVLTDLILWGNGINDEGAKAIGEALAVNEVLKTLDLSVNSFSAAGGAAIADALAFNAVLKKLYLRCNNIGWRGAVAIAEALRVNAVLNTLDLYSTDIGPRGAAALGEALKVNMVLKSIDVRSNLLGDKAEKAIRDAVEGEEFEIMCPDGAGAGDVITVTVDGDELELEIPEGVVAGETFSVRIE